MPSGSGPSVVGPVEVRVVHPTSRAPVNIEVLDSDDEAKAINRTSKHADGTCKRRGSLLCRRMMKCKELRRDNAKNSIEQANANGLEDCWDVANISRQGKQVNWESLGLS